MVGRIRTRSPILAVIAAVRRGRGFRRGACILNAAKRSMVPSCSQFSVKVVEQRQPAHGTPLVNLRAQHTRITHFSRHLVNQVAATKPGTPWLTQANDFTSTIDHEIAEGGEQ
jgi:hypothetical protein